jgi:hypothetical protein
MILLRDPAPPPPPIIVIHHPPLLLFFTRRSGPPNLRFFGPSFSISYSTLNHYYSNPFGSSSSLWAESHPCPPTQHNLDTLLLLMIDQ